MFKALFITLLLFSSVSFADTPLNFKYKIVCMFDKECKSNRALWGFEELNSQFLKTIYSYDVFINSIPKAMSSVDELKIITMTLDSYLQQLDRFIQIYEFVINTSGSISGLDREVVLEMSYLWAAMVTPSEILLNKEYISNLETEYPELKSFLRFEALSKKMETLRAGQFGSSELIAVAMDELEAYELAAAKNDGSSLIEVQTFIEIERPRVYIISNPKALNYLLQDLSSTSRLILLSIKDYMLIKQLEIEVEDLIEKNSIKPKDRLQQEA